jgi:hypothetical protein
VIIPDAGVKQFVLDLARQHGVTHAAAPTDKLADVITRLADDEIVFDPVEKLIVALERGRHITGPECIELHAAYLREKLGTK